MSALLGVLGAALLFALFAWGAMRFGSVERAGASCGGADGHGTCGTCALFGTTACSGNSNHQESDEPDGPAVAASRSWT